VRRQGGEEGVEEGLDIDHRAGMAPVQYMGVDFRTRPGAGYSVDPIRPSLKEQEEVEEVAKFHFRTKACDCVPGSPGKGLC